MLHEFAQDIVPLTNAPIVERLAERLRCPECLASPLTFYGDDSVDRNILDHGVLVCDACKACYPYEHGTLFLMPERPDGAGHTRRSGLFHRTASAIRPLLRVLCAWRRTGGPWSVERTPFLFDELSTGVPGGLTVVHFGTADRNDALDLAQQLKEQPSAGFVVAIDSSPTRLAAAVTRAQRMQLQDRVLWVLADARSVPLVDGTADRVTCVAGLNEYSEIRGVLSEVRRILGPKGRFHAAVVQRRIGPAGILQNVLRRASGLRVMGTAEWQALLSAHFEIEHQEARGPWLFARMK